MRNDSIKERFQVVEAKRWIHVDGRTASVYGAVPYTSDSDKANWSMQSVGWTVRNTQDGTVGIGRVPFKTQDDAQAWCDAKNVSLYLNHAYHHVSRTDPENGEARIILAQYRPAAFREVSNEL